MSLDNTLSTDRPTHTTDRQTERLGAAASHPTEHQGSDNATLEIEKVSTGGSMALGKERKDEQVIATEPEKHLTPRATSKEFTFPKSN